MADSVKDMHTGFNRGRADLIAVNLLDVVINKLIIAGRVGYFKATVHRDKEVKAAFPVDNLAPQIGNLATSHGLDMQRTDLFKPGA